MTKVLAGVAIGVIVAALGAWVWVVRTWPRP